MAQSYRQAHTILRVPLEEGQEFRGYFNEIRNVFQMYLESKDTLSVSVNILNDTQTKSLYETSLTLKEHQLVNLSDYPLPKEAQVAAIILKGQLYKLYRWPDEQNEETLKIADGSELYMKFQAHLFKFKYIPIKRTKIELQLTKGYSVDSVSPQIIYVNPLGSTYPEGEHEGVLRFEEEYISPLIDGANVIITPENEESQLYRLSRAKNGKT